jgi:DNA-binding MarR family transcriptional regulator
VRHFSDRMGRARSRTSMIVRRLEARGFIEVQPGRDQRLKSLLLTEHGKYAAETAETKIDAFAKSVFSELTKRERERLHEFLFGFFDH